MSRTALVTIVLILGGLMERSAPLQAEAQVVANEASTRPPRPVEAADVARLPAPGSVVPGAFAFTPDSKSLTYLKSESASLSRVLWRVDLPVGTPRVIARPPGQGDTEANLSEAEKLRRERQRLRETGITQAVRAEKADVSIIPLRGDLYLLRGDGPLERITETSSPEIDPRLTRDGTHVAFVRDDELFVIDLASRQETQLTRGAGDGLTHGLAEFIAQEEMDRSMGFWWSPDGARIAYQETEERQIALYTIAHQGGEKYSVETHRYPFSGAANARVRLGIIASGGGETRWLALGETDDEDVYLARVTWDGPVTLLVQVLNRAQTALRLYRFDAQSGARTLLVENRDTAWVNLHDDLKVVEETGEFVWSSERTGFKHLELRDRSGQLVRVLTSGEWPVDEVVALDQKRREVWFNAGRESPLELHLYRVALEGGEPVRLTREPGMHRVSVDRNGYFVDVASSRSKPPVTTIRDRAGKVLLALGDAASDPRIAELRLDRPALTEFKSRDGVRLFGAYYAPKSTAPGTKVPLVVLVYGGPHVQTVTESWGMTADLTAQYLTARGFAVWKCDNRGSSRRGHTFESALNRHMGTIEVRDQVDGVRFAAASWPEIDASRVGITGGSYGGYMTLRCLTEAPDTFRAGVAVAPVTDWDGYDTCYTERYMSTPASNPDGYRDSSVLTAAARLRGDLLIIHGMLDENVHFRHTARLTTALLSSGKPFSLLPLPDERHSSRREGDRKYVAERLADFLTASLSATRDRPD
jgi:dipeptidyl-peptidase-4